MNSKVVSYGYHADTRFELQPQHRYVVSPRHMASGDFYSLDKSWKLRGGSVYPNTAEDEARAKARTSLYSGMREEEFFTIVPALAAK